MKSKTNSDWHQLKNRRRAMWMVPGALLLISWGIKDVAPNAPLFLFVAAIVSYLILQARYERWKCPRCGRQFQRDGKVASECANCGLPKYSTLQ